METRKNLMTHMLPDADHKMLTSTPSTSSAGGQFRATELWHELVAGLRQQMTKHRRVKLKATDRSFTGQAATDVVLQMLLSDKYSFTNKNIKRENAVKLCQLMLDSHVLKPVVKRSDRSKSLFFEDNGLKFYKFDDVEEEKKRKENIDGDGDNRSCVSCQELAGTSSIGSFDNRNQFSESDPIIGSNLSASRPVSDVTNVWRRHSTANTRPMSPLTRHDSRRSLVDIGVHSAAPFPPAVVDEVRREVALTKLLAIIHIPILDSILSYDPTAHTRSAAAYSNLAFRRYESICSIFSDSSSKDDDSWWDAGLDCLAGHPNGLDILDTSLTEDSIMTQKLRLYQAIADHYSKLTQPLWPDHFSDVQVGVFRLLMEQRHDVAVRGLQLSFILLSDTLRTELRYLLDFLHQAVKDDAVTLSSQCSNRDHVEQTFTSAVMRNTLLAPHQAGQVLLFLIDRVDDVWRESEEVEVSVRVRLTQIHNTDMVHKPMLDYAYCHQVSAMEFQHQQQQCTENALVDLVNTILDDTNLHLKDKKQKLKQFQKYHSELFQKHFSDLKW